MGAKGVLVMLFILLSTLSHAQEFKGIETSTAIDKYVLFPYHSLLLHFDNGFNIEAGYVDYPHSTNAHFQSSIRNNAGTLSSIIPILPDYGDYKKRTRGMVPYYFIGYQFNQNNFSINIQNGWCHDNNYTLKIKPIITLYQIKEQDSIVKFQIHTQVFLSEKSTYTFLGYSMYIGM
jgi:hypothetical protein